MESEPVAKQIDNQTKSSLAINVGDSVSFSDLKNKLTKFGYINVSPGAVIKIGEFSIRGGMMDIWLERYKLPARVDFIGNDVESIYLFNTLTQEKVKLVKEVYVVPFGITPKLGLKWGKKFPVKRYERLFFSEIKKGDLVVHIDHGIGKFVGLGGQGSHQQSSELPNPRGSIPSYSRNQSILVPSVSQKSGQTLHLNETRKSNHLAAQRQFLIVEYAGGDKLYVPINQIDRLTKYIGVSGRRPQITKLGGMAWERVKQKVQDNVLKYAQELLQLYAKREVAKRPPFGRDTPWQRQLEESFGFSQTNDQIQAVKDIKKDLERDSPMDRILVGDVGYGKTEVAIRAAFKVVQENRQVAVLVPTTILADQHFFVFSERLKRFPVRVELLSRFKKEAEEKNILESLKSGKVDIVIGTHRLFSKDVEFKNLGLLIIDEEHRFGVQHKERLKLVRPLVDVLSMSATPIPRSLQMALTHIRDLSVLRQPPVGRKPIATFVGPYSDEKVKSAIEKETDRGGQIYYVFNNVGKIAGRANEIANLVPSAKIVYAHGRMNGLQLEKSINLFYSGKADVLVCTTIIGSGIDMPNVNTIIVENAERFGLADLYQLRGRVGRSENKSFAYLFYPKDYAPEGKVLERLSAISEATDLGSGFKIARKDLEVRGAGNLLGTAQSGNIALVGFELYTQLLSQAVETLKFSAKGH